MDEYFVEDQTGYDKLLNFLVFIAVLVVTIFLILDIIGQNQGFGIDTFALNSIYLWVSLAVFAIFILDLIRLWSESENMKDFLNGSWLDILATIPFELIALAFAGIPASAVNQFGILKWIRITKLSRAGKIGKIARISKVSKEFKAAAHMKKEGENYKRKHRL